MVTWRPLRSRSLVIAFGAILALLPAAPVSADTSIEEVAKVGPHALLDSRAFPGVECVYGTDTNLVRLRVRPPTMYARDRSSDRDRQWVGWQVDLRFKADRGTWSTIKHTSVIKVRAWDDTPAAFRTRSVTTPGAAGSGSYRIQVRMLWYKPGSDTTVQGSSRHRADVYTFDLVEGSPIGYCPGGVL